MPQSATKAKPSRIAAELAPLVVPIDSVSLSPRNPREGDVGAIVTSLERFGQLKPIVVQESTGHVVAGNHMYRAALALNWPDIAVNRVALSDKDARAYMIADNRTADLGTYDQDVLTDMLKELALDDDLAGTGYDGDDVDEMLAKQDWDRQGGSPIIQYVLIFDDETQQEAWTAFLRKLRKRYSDHGDETHAYRIALFLAEQNIGA